MNEPCIFAGPEEPKEITTPLEAIIEKGVSDYQFYGQGKSILIQRKVSPQDFYSSWMDGRLNRNEVELLDNIDRGGISYLLMEGQLRYDRGKLIVGRRVSNLTVVQVTNRLASMQDKGIRILPSPSIEETVRIIAGLYTWWQKERTGERTRPGPKSQSLWGKVTASQRIIWVLQGFDGIGPSLAKDIWYTSKTLRRFIGFSPELMQIIPGLGPKRVAEITSVLDMEFPERLKSAMDNSKD